MEKIIEKNNKKIIFITISSNNIDLSFIFYYNIKKEGKENVRFYTYIKQRNNKISFTMTGDNITSTNYLGQQQTSVLTDDNYASLFNTAKKIIKLILKYFFPTKIDLINSSLKINYLNEFNFSENIKIVENELKSYINDENNKELLNIAKNYIIDILYLIDLFIKNRLPFFKFEIPYFLHNKNSALLFFGDFLKMKEEYSSQIYKIYLIEERNLLLIVFKTKIKLFDINDFKTKNSFCEITFEKGINIKEFITVKYDLLISIPDNRRKGNFFIFKIIYDSFKKPINIIASEDTYFTNLDNFLKIIDVIGENIICVSRNSIYLVWVNKSGFFLKKKIQINNDFALRHSTIDKYNNKIIFMGHDSFIFYDLNNEVYLKKNFGLYLKKNFGLYHFKTLKILNKDNYIITYYNKQMIYLVSSKYLEIVSIINLNKKYDDIYIMNNSNTIFMYSFLLKHLTIYKLEKNTLINVQSYFCPQDRKIIFIKEINNKGDYILAIKKTYLYFPQGKYYARYNKARFHKKNIYISKLYHSKYNTLKNILSVNDNKNNKYRYEDYDDEDFDDKVYDNEKYEDENNNKNSYYDSGDTNNISYNNSNSNYYDDFEEEEIDYLIYYDKGIVKNKHKSYKNKFKLNRKNKIIKDKFSITRKNKLKVYEFKNSINAKEKKKVKPKKNYIYSFNIIYYDDNNNDN